MKSGIISFPRFADKNIYDRWNNFMDNLSYRDDDDDDRIIRELKSRGN